MKKLKKLSVLVLLAAGFALAFSGCSNTKDETGTEQGGEAGSGGETGGTGGSNDGTEKPGDSDSSGDNTGSNGDATGSGGDNSSGGQTDNGGDSNPGNSNAPKTKFTNSAWNKAVEKQYDGVFIDVSSIDYPENFDFSEYDFLKVNVTFSKGGEEVTTAWSTGFAHLQKKNGDSHETLLTISNINNGVSSKYNSAWFPIAMLKEVPEQLAVQSAEGSDKIDLVTVNYIEFVKIEGLKKGVENNVASIVNSGKTGDKVVFAVVYDDSAKNYNGIGQIQLPDSPWTASDVTFLSDGNVKPGYIQEIEKSYDEVKTASDTGYTGLSFYNGAFLQYVYIK